MGRQQNNDDSVSLLLFHLPMYFDDTGLETLLQPVTEDGRSTTVESTTQDYEQVVHGSIWGAYNGRRFVIASVPRRIAQQFINPDPNAALAEHEALEASGAKRKREPVSDVRKRKYIKALSVVNYESFQEQVDALEKTLVQDTADENAGGEKEVISDDMLLSDLLNQQEDDEERKAEEAKEKRKRSLAAARAARSINIGGAPIAICESPIRFEDVDAFAGGNKSKAWKKHLDDEHRAKQRKRPDEYLPRPETGDEEGNNADEEQKPASKTQKNILKAQAEAKGFGADQCKKCGSYDHLTRHCTGAAAPAAPAAPAQEKVAEVQPAVVETKKSFSGDVCKKCGSDEHLSRHCPGPKAAAPVETQPVVETKKSFSGDVCKKCGSDEHLSRHCPGPKAAAPAQVQPAVVETKKSFNGDVCKKCGSDEHLSRHCPGPKAAPAATTTQPPITVAARGGGDSCRHCGSNDHLTRRCPNK